MDSFTESKFKEWGFPTKIIEVFKGTCILFLTSLYYLEGRLFYNKYLKIDHSRYHGINKFKK